MEEVPSKKPLSSTRLYLHTALFSLVVFGVLYAYTSWFQLFNDLNRSAADTAIFLIGLSMILSGVCYFWNVFDWAIKYRKYLGLVGWAFAITHVILSYPTLIELFKLETWEAGLMWPALNGYLAIIIFSLMALVSNTYMATKLGTNWRPMLRTGYIAVMLVMAHVILLRLPSWTYWLEQGMPTPPTTSMLVTIFMVLVLTMRVALWLATRRKKKDDENFVAAAEPKKNVA